MGNVRGVSFWIGVRWGLGYSVSLLLAGATVILLRRTGVISAKSSVNSNDDDDVEDVFEIPLGCSWLFNALSGCCMIVLGACKC